MKLSYMSKMFLRMFDKESDYKLHKYVEDLLSEDVERQQHCLCTVKQFFKQTKDMKYFFLLAYGIELGINSITMNDYYTLFNLDNDIDKLFIKMALAYCYLMKPEQIKQDKEAFLNILSEYAKQKKPKSSLELILYDVVHFWLGTLYLEGRNIEKDLTKAFQFFIIPARNGDLLSQYYVGLLYLNGEGVKKNLEEALKWIEKAAVQEFALAQNILGIMYLNGEGTKRDLQKALKWFEKAASYGDADAHHNLGILYKYVNGFDLDLDKAYNYFNQAAKLGHKGAEGERAWLDIIKYNKKEAVETLFQLSLENDARAQLRLGILYEKGNMLEQNLKEARSYYFQAANRGCIAAMRNLAVLLEKDNEHLLAWNWRFTAAEKGCELNQCYCGIAFLEGKAFNKNGENISSGSEARVWLQKSAEQGLHFAQHILAVLYEEGYGGEKNLDLAELWYKKSAVQGYAEAQCNLGLMYLSRTIKSIKPGNMWSELYYIAYRAFGGQHKDISEGLKWLNEAANNKDASSVAQCYLGDYYKEGRFVKKDRKRAVEWYFQSMALGNCKAESELLSLVKADDPSSSQITILFYTIHNIYNVHAEANSVVQVGCQDSVLHNGSNTITNNNYAVSIQQNCCKRIPDAPSTTQSQKILIINNHFHVQAETNSVLQVGCQNSVLHNGPSSITNNNICAISIQKNDCTKNLDKSSITLITPAYDSRVSFGRQSVGQIGCQNAEMHIGSTITKFYDYHLFP